MLAPSVTVEVVQVTVGAVIVQLWVAGEASAFSATSIARTRKVCWPTARPVNACGDVHGANAAVSSAHSNVEPASLETNPKLASDSGDGDSGITLSDVSGAVESGDWTVHVWVSGDASMLPAASTARTRKLCWPVARPV